MHKDFNSMKGGAETDKIKYKTRLKKQLILKHI